MQPKLLDRIRMEVRTRHYAIRTEEAYVMWAKRFILFHGKKHPSAMGADEINAFLTHLAVEKNVAASTQGQALSAILFLYKEVLKENIGWIDDLTRATKPRRLPVVFTRREVEALLGAMSGVERLIGELLYGTGLRVIEAVRLRVKDLEFERNEILVRGGKGRKDRRTMLPRSVVPRLREHLAKVRAVHDADLARGGGAVYLPHALAEKAPDRRRVRHPDRAGTAGPRGREDDDDLHPRAEPGRPGGAQSDGRDHDTRRNRRRIRSIPRDAAGITHALNQFRAGR